MSDATIDIRLILGPLSPAETWHVGAAGAVVTFDGVVRPSESDGVIEALDYEVYEPMTGREMQRLARDVRDAFGLIGIRVDHSVGRVAVGQISFRLRIAAAHRRAAIDATDSFIARMKRDVPIWKNPVWRKREETK